MFLKSSQNSVSHFLFLAANTLPHPHLSLISLHRNTSSNHDLKCNSWLALEFLPSEIRKRQRWGKVLAQPKIKCVLEFWSDFSNMKKKNVSLFLHGCLIVLSWWKVDKPKYLANGWRVRGKDQPFLNLIFQPPLTF